MGQKPGAIAFTGVNVFFALALVGLSCTVLGVNRRQLWYGAQVCWDTTLGVFCSNYVTGCLVSSNHTWHVPCQYAFAVGSVGLFFGLIACVYQCSDLAPVGNAIMGVLNTVWWVVAASLFTEWDKDISLTNYPQEHWRTVLLAICWTAASVSIVMLLMSGCQFMVWKNMWSDDANFDTPEEAKKDEEHHHHKHKPEAELAAGPAAPPAGQY